MFQAFLQDFQQCFNVGRTNRRDQEFFLLGQLFSVFHCVLRRIVSRVFLPPEGEWEAIHDFKFIGSTLLELIDFVRKTQLRTSVLRVANPNMDMGRVKSKKKLRAHAMISAAIDDSSNLFRVSAELSSLYF